MKPEVEGRGGGFGKYSGLKLAEIQALFDTCVEDPTMRSISAVLRITREQMDARGQLGIYPVFAWVAALACFAGLAARTFGPPGLTELATKTALGAGAVFVLLMITTLPTRHARKTNLTQERLIREMAVKAIVQILDAKPSLKPLTFEQEFTVKMLMKKSPGSEALQVLL